MATTSPVTTGRHHARSITAAAQRIDLASKADRAGIPAKSADWQTLAWSMFDRVPEVKFAARFLGNSLSRLLLYPGLRLAQDENPASLRAVWEMQEEMRRQDESGPPKDDPRPWYERAPFPGLTLDMVEAAEDEMTRIRSLRHGVAGLLRAWGVCLTIPGESYLVGVDERGPDGEPTGREDWMVLSDQNVEKRGGQVLVRLAPKAKWEPLPESATFIRVWRPHEAWPHLADSNMSAVLDVCEELLVYSSQFRAVGRSRNNAGVLLIPNELDFATPVTYDENGDPVGDADDLTPLERELIKSLTTPVGDDASAAAVVPHILRGPSDALEKVRHIPLDRKIDEHAVDRVNHLISRLAHGLDVPVEVLTGMADVNHWTAWQIEDATYQAHVEPLAMLPAHALAVAHMQPMLAQHPAWSTDDGRRILQALEVGIDPAMLVVRPNRAQDAKDAHQAGAISDAALRRYLGFSDADAPTDEERLERYALQRGIGGVTLTREVMRATIDGAEDIITDPAEANDVTPARPSGSAPAAPRRSEQDNPTPAEQRPAAAAGLGVVAALDTVAGLGRRSPIARQALVAAAQGNVGARLAAIDTRLRDRVQVAAASAVDEALRVAGNRLRARAANDPALRASVVGIDPREVGPALAAAGALTEEEEDQAMDGAFAALAVLWDDWTGAATTEVANVISSASDEALSGPVAAEYRAQAEEDRAAGWALLSGALSTLVRSRLRGSPDPVVDDEPGEVDDLTAVVPTQTVRQALARAGGAVDAAAPPATAPGALNPGAAGGVATGPRALGALIRVGLATVGWEWTVGMPSRPFEPHQRLAGVQFASWDDPRLVSAGWPGYGFYFPGDHRGCQCDAVPVIVAVDAARPDRLAAVATQD